VSLAAPAAPAGEYSFEFTSKPLGISLGIIEKKIAVKEVKREGTPIQAGH
jgi:hypothetical protein